MTQPSTSQRRAVIIGAGPAGLTAAYELADTGLVPIVLEKGKTVGGLARTEKYKGYYFDIGGHRFFTKSDVVRQMWQDVLGNDFLRRPRLSRIYYNGRFYYYPLRLCNTFRNLGLGRSIVIGLSYLRWQLSPYAREDSFEQWVTNRFGRCLFQTFFKSYTEKVWGIPCSELRAEWAAQRIKDLSLRVVLRNMFLSPKEPIKTLIEEFDYPRFGPGMMWTAVVQRIEQRGGVVQLDSEIAEVRRNGRRVQAVVVARGKREEVIAGTDFISSMPVTELIRKLRPAAPDEVLQAARELRYRDFVTICLIINRPHVFPDNWIYVHDPSVRVARIQNYKNWSPDMVPDSRKTSLGLEYFCNEGDFLWSLSDPELIEVGKHEVEQIGLVAASDVLDGCVVRVPKSYPIYDSHYRDHLAVVRKFVDRFVNLQTIGRNGLHRYDNQDHAMLTGMYAVRNLFIDPKIDLWAVNAEKDYYEEVSTDCAGRSDRVRAGPAVC